MDPSRSRRLAAPILAELDAEQRWEELFAGSQEALGRLAERALEEYGAG